LDGILGMTNGKIEYKTTNTFFIFCDQSRRPSKTPFGNVEIVGKFLLRMVYLPYLDKTLPY